MKKIFYITALACSLLTIAGCRQDEWSDAEGTLRLEVGIREKVEVGTRTISDDEQAALEAGCKISIHNAQGKVRQYEGLNNLPEAIHLKADSYTARAVAGDSVPAAFDKKFYRGTQAFDITPGGSTAIEVKCNLANTVVKVNFASSLATLFGSSQVTITTADGELVYTQEQDGIAGYFMLPADNRQLTWSFTGKPQSSGSDFVRTGSITDAQGSTLYDLTFSYEDTGDYTDGGGHLTLDVDTTPLEENTSEIPIYQRPSFMGEGFDFDAGLFVEVGKGEETSFWIATSSVLTQALISCEQFTTLGLPVNSFDMVAMTKQEREEYAALGVTINAKHNVMTGQGNMKVCFSEALMQKLSQTEGVYEIAVNAQDQNGMQRSQQLVITVSNAIVVTEQPKDADIWWNRATLQGRRVRETSDALSFRYREKGSGTWNTVEAQLNESTLYANITGLSADTRYEYQAVAGTAASTITCEFTTETAAQLPNGGFEQWNTASDGALIFSDSEADMFWDSGNHGSITLNKNVTTQETTTTLIHGGSSSVKMQSQKVAFLGIGKFAAGNLFVGKYLATDGTDGVLGWGRPFTSRPTKLRGYVCYQPQTIAYTSSDCPDAVEGETDKGAVYIALGDWAGEEYNGETWPVIVKTKTKQFFNPEGEEVIAYGEQVWSKATDGQKLIPFEITLDYRTTARKPTHIIVVASASKYGDYFAGGEGSTLWIDDLELVYE